jgi:hypothetical protein
MHRSKQQLHSITRSPRGSSSHQLGLRRVARIFGGQREADGGRDDDRDAVGLKQRLDRRRDRPAHGHRRDEQGYQPRNLHAEAAAGKPVERREHEGRILRRRFVERPQRGEAAVIGQAAGAPRPMALRARAMSRGVMLAPQQGGNQRIYEKRGHHDGGDDQPDAFPRARVQVGHHTEGHGEYAEQDRVLPIRVRAIPVIPAVQRLDWRIPIARICHL